MYVLQLRRQWLQCLSSIIHNKDRQVPPPYIQGLVPRVFEHLQAVSDKTASITDLQLTLDELALIETLVALVDDDKSKFT